MGNEIMFENGEKYVRIYKENDMKGYRLLEVGEAIRDGDQVKIGYGGWVDICCSIGEVVREDNGKHDCRMPYGWYRRKIEFDVTQQSKESEPPIKSYPIEDLMKWRNTASARVDKLDFDLKYIDNCIKDLHQDRRRLLKKRQKDVRWIVKLNKNIYDRCIKQRG